VIKSLVAFSRLGELFCLPASTINRRNLWKFRKIVENLVPHQFLLNAISRSFGPAETGAGRDFRHRAAQEAALEEDRI
jgi:hypothetical protein